MPNVSCPLSTEHFQELLDHVDPLAGSFVYGEDLYVSTLDFVLRHL